MHPNLMNNLARQRQAERRDEYHFRDNGDEAVSRGAHGAGRRLRQVRRSVGSALVMVGTRLLPANQPVADWALQASRDSTVR